MADISVIIPARNAAGTLPAALDSLEQQEFEGQFEVIVVDDGSSDATHGLAVESPVVTNVVALEGQGPAVARNAGAAASSASRLAFLDADCRATGGWLKAGISALDDAHLVLGATLPDPLQPLGRFDRTIWVTDLSPLFESANLFVRSELFDSLGGFESWLRPRRGIELGEDVWFGWQARRKGAEIAFCAEALAYHAVYPRDAFGFMSESWRFRFFPAMVKRIPELRREFCHRRLFHSRRSAALDYAVAGVTVAAWRRSLLPLAAAIPYARILRDDALGGRNPGGVPLAAGRFGADVVGALALLYGSMRSRSPLL